MESVEPPTSTTLSSSKDKAVFHLFPLLPTELQIQVWQEAASVPRVVLMEPSTAHYRSLAFYKNGIPDTYMMRHRVPALLQVNYLARQICLPIYKHKLHYMGARETNLWETYFFADHDILSLSDLSLRYLIWRCELRDQDKAKFSKDFHSEDWYAWMALGDSAMAGELQLDFLDRVATPQIKKILQQRMDPPVFKGFRGDLGAMKQLVLYMGDETYDALNDYPGLDCNVDVLTNLDRAFTAVPDCTEFSQPCEYASLLTEAGVVELPERYRCKPLSCPLHPGICDRYRPTIGIARTPLDMGEWLKACAIVNPRTKKQSNGYPLGTLPKCHFMVKWYFSEPRFGAAPMAVTASPSDCVTERYAAHLQTMECGITHQLVTVYEGHVEEKFSTCKWSGYHGDIRSYDRHVPLKESDLSQRTPGCVVCMYQTVKEE